MGKDFAGPGFLRLFIFECVLYVISKLPAASGAGVDGVRARINNTGDGGRG